MTHAPQTHRAVWRLTATALALGALLALGACDRRSEQPTAGASAPAGGQTAAQQRPFEGQTVTVAVGSFMSSGVNMFKDEWEKRTGAKLQVVEIPFGDLYQRLFASFTTGAGEFDVAIYAANWIPEFAANKNILSLEQRYAAKDNWGDVLDKTQRIMYVGTERYSVPLDGDVLMGYYRKDALENDAHKQKFKAKYGYDLAAPTTWKQYRDIAEFFNGWDWTGDGKPDFGVLEAQGPKDVGPFILLSRVASYAANPKVPGSLFFDPETMEPSVNNPGWVQALQDWVDIRKFGPAEMATMGGGTMRGNFVAGNYALAIDWADVGIQAQDESASIVKGKLGYFVLPGSDRVWNIKAKAWDKFPEPQRAPYMGWGGWHGSVAANSKAPDAAWDFLNFIDSNDNALRAVTTPGTARNPYRKQHFADPAKWEQAAVKYKEPAEYLQVQQQSFTHANTQYDLRIPKAGRYFEVLDNWMQQALAGTMSPKQALDKTAEEWKRITDEAGKDKQLQLYRDLYELKSAK